MFEPCNPPVPRPWPKQASKQEMDQIKRLLAPWRRLTAPLVRGMENVPDDRPLLFVGNHTTYGILDAPLLFLELYETRGIFLRSLGDRIHFNVPFWGKQLEKYGVIVGSRDHCAALFEDNECVLVFPGGAREVSKRKDEKYRLVWKERVGFARMAIEYGATIVPFAAVGAEDLFHIVADADDLFQTRPGRWLKKLGIREDVVWPFSIPSGKLERFYFQIQPPISTSEFAGQGDDTERCWEIRERVAAAIEEGVQELIEYRREDPLRRLPSRSKMGRRG